MNKLKLYGILVLVFGACLFAHNFAFAEDQLMIDNDINEVSGYGWARASTTDDMSGNWIGQTFIPNENNISKIGFVPRSSAVDDYYDHDLTVHLCKGDYTEITYWDCTGGQYITEWIVPAQDWDYQGAGAPYAMFYVELTDPTFSVSGDTYMFTLHESTGTTTNLVFEHDNGNNSYADGRVWNCLLGSCTGSPSQVDLSFEIYYDNEYGGTYNNNYVYDPITGWITININSVISEDCFTGEVCNHWFNHSPFLTGDTMYLIERGGTTSPTNAIASTTILETSDHETYIQLPDYASGTVMELCYYLIDEHSPVIYTDYLYCSGLTVTWYDQASWESDLWNRIEEEYGTSTSRADQIDMACVGLDSSWLEYPFECALRKFYVWLTAPEPKDLQIIKTINEEILNSFPVNIVNRFRKIIGNKIGYTQNQSGDFIDSGNATSTVVKLIPLLGATGTPIGYYLDMTDWQNSERKPLIDFIKSKIEIILYFVTGLIIIVVILRKQ